MSYYFMIRRLRGPAFLLLVGVLALLNQAHILSWGKSWPLYLILAGLLALAERAAQDGDLSEIHDVRVRLGPGGYYVIFHCRANSDLTVSTTHDRVDALERELRDRFPEVIRIVGHAEPAR